MNAFILALGDLEELAHLNILVFLDSFHTQIKWPHHKLLADNFFQVRTRGFGQHIKAFACETMAAVTALELFCTEVLDPTKTLAQHSKSMHLLADISDILKVDDVSQTDVLRQKLKEHRHLFVELYGLAYCTPKLHYAEHLPDVQDMWQMNIDCKACETMHGEAKRVSEHLLLPECAESALLIRTLATLFGDMQHTSFTAVHLIKPLPVPVERGLCLDAMGYGYSMAVARSIHTAVGEFKQGQLAKISGSGNTCQLGIVELAMSGCALGSPCARCFVGCRMFRQVSAREWTKSEELHVVAAEDLASHVAYYFLASGNIVPIFRL